MQVKWFNGAIRACLAWQLTIVAAAAALAPTGEKTAPVPQDSSAMAARVDELFAQIWDADHVKPAPLTSDGEFLRRAYLDLNGVIPRVAEVRAFDADKRPQKRVELVDHLLASPRYAT